MMAAGVRAEGVRKRFGAVQALDGADVAVESGEVVVLLGVNGAGKSTLLRVLGTTVIPDGGTVEVAGVDAVARPREVRRRTGVVLSDERSWYYRLSARANLEFFGRLSELSRAEARARTAELLALVQLTGAAERRLDGFSSGMRARLSLARALVLDPPVLLLDEPSRALDPAVARDLRQVVTGLARDRGHAVLWVTHDLHEAVELADQVVVLDAGRTRRLPSAPRTAAELADVLGVGAEVAPPGLGVRAA